jgi:hypothetical protein
MAVYSVTQQSFRVADTQMFGVHRTAGNGITMVKDTHHALINIGSSVSDVVLDKEIVLPTTVIKIPV